MLKKILALLFTIFLSYCNGQITSVVKESSWTGADHLPFSIVEFSTLPNIAVNELSQLDFRWKLGIIPFLIDTNRFDYILRRKMVNVMNKLAQETCLRFQPLAAPPTDNSFYLNITTPDDLRDRDCSHYTELDDADDNSVVHLRIGYDCLKQSDLLHAMVHAAGMKDEVNHPQRDKYVRVMWENIKPEHRTKFRLNKEMGVQGLYEYDPFSITHFHDRAFTRNGQATIVPLMAGLQIQPSKQLSLLDRQKLQALYAHECNKRKISTLTHSCKHIMKGKLVHSPCDPQNYPAKKLSLDLTNVTEPPREDGNIKVSSTTIHPLELTTRKKGTIRIETTWTIRGKWANKTSVKIELGKHKKKTTAFWANMTGMAATTAFRDWANMTGMAATKDAGRMKKKTKNKKKTTHKKKTTTKKIK